VQRSERATDWIVAHNLNMELQQGVGGEEPFQIRRTLGSYAQDDVSVLQILEAEKFPISCGPIEMIGGGRNASDHPYQVRIIAPPAKMLK